MSAASTDEPLLLVEGDAAIHDAALAPLDARPRGFAWLLAAAAAGAAVFFAAITYTVLTGIGTWGNNIPVAWAFAITNFVWWIGIGHAGTFISAFLLLLRQPWRNAISRVSEAMTLFALANAGLFPLLHLGRPWFFYWLAPYPATMQVWPQFRSSLTWDVAAVSTYTLVSILFWYLGLLPDLAAARDRATTLRARRCYGFFALGWRSSIDHWRRWRVGYVILAGLAAPLVVSVHSIVSCDFAIGLVPGWHSLIFPPYFVAGALLSGFAMVAMILVPLRRWMRLGLVVTTKHLEQIARMVLITGTVVGYSYVVELFQAWYGGDPYDARLALHTRPVGPAAWAWWIAFTVNVLGPQLMWLRACRRRPLLLFAICCLIQLAMWCERYAIIVGSLSRDFLPSSWASYAPSPVDLALLAGSLAFFATLFLLFLRFVPPIPMAELKGEAHGEEARP